MAISVVTNVASIRSQRNLAKVTLSTSQNIERLSSGCESTEPGMMLREVLSHLR